MKRMILITGIVIYSLFAVAMIIDSGEKEEAAAHFINETYASQAVTQTEEKNLYVVKIVDNRVAVTDADSGRVIQKTDTLASILPKGDRKLLLKGIKVNSDKQLRLLLEDYCS